MYTLPADFISELAKHVFHSLPAEYESDTTLAGLIPKLIKEFITGDAAPWEIKIARNSATLNENKGKLVFVVPASKATPVFVGVNDTHFKSSDLKECIKSAVGVETRITEKIHPSHGAGYNVPIMRDDDYIDEVFAAFKAEVEAKNKRVECALVRIAPRPETAHSLFMRKAHEKYPENSIVENSKLWTASEERKVAQAEAERKKAEKKAESEIKKAEKKAESDRKKAEKEAAKIAKAKATIAERAAKAVATAVDDTPTQTFPEPDPTLVVDNDATLVVEPEPEPVAPAKKQVRRK